MLGVVVTIVLCTTSSVYSRNAEAYQYSYDEYYNDYDDYSNNTQHADTEEVPHTENPRFVADVTCSPASMLLVISRGHLPAGLGLPEETSEENGQKRSEENVEADDVESSSCTKKMQNSSHFVYEVSMSCPKAYDVMEHNGLTIYSHELFLIDSGNGADSERKPYSVVIKCEKSANRLGELWRSMYQIFERREGSSCSSSCRYGDLCLPSEDLAGYACQCSVSHSDSCQCPDGYYRCAANNKRAKGLQTTSVCLNNSTLCDSNLDCPLQDDERCDIHFEAWSRWSQCSVTCGSGFQTRQRRCTKSHRTKRKGISMECLESDGKVEMTRSCERANCSVVECGADTMRIEIPFQNGMTRESVRRKLRIRNHGESLTCTPQVNSTHATFVIPLHDCNTKTWVDGDIVFYSNAIDYRTDDGKDSVIVRDYGHSYTVKCQYKRRQSVSMRRLNPNSSAVEQDEVAVLQFGERTSGSLRDTSGVDLTKHYSSGDGVFEYYMDIYEDSSYSKAYAKEDFPLHKRLGEKLYVAVNFMSQDEDLSVFIERCIAISESEIQATYDDARYLFINGGCAVDPTVQFHNVRKNPFSDRFSIDSFKFNDARYPYIYFRCEVIVCDTEDNDPACQRNCNLTDLWPSRRQKRSANDFPRMSTQVFQGPIVVLDENDFVASKNWKWDVKSGTVEHKILGLQDVRREKIQNHSSSKDQRFGSISVLVALVVGAVCLTSGLVIGVLLRKGNKQAVREKSNNRESKLGAEKRLEQEDESLGAMMEDC